MIAEGAIVGVFHDAHKLDGVVSGLNDARTGSVHGIRYKVLILASS